MSHSNINKSVVTVRRGHFMNSHLFGMVLGPKWELQLLCETMSFRFTCKCMMWDCGCPSVVVIGNWVFGFTCKCMVWGCGCPSVVVIGNWVLLYLSHCIQLAFNLHSSTSCLQGFLWQNKREIISLDAKKCQVLQKTSPSPRIVLERSYPGSLY